MVRQIDPMDQKKGKSGAFPALTIENPDPDFTLTIGPAYVYGPRSSPSSFYAGAVDVAK